MMESRNTNSNNPFSQGEDYGPRGEAIRSIRRAVVLLAAITTVGTLGYIVFEGWSFIDAFYMTIITISTVGFEEVHALDTAGRLWTMGLIVGGIGALGYAASSLAVFTVEGAVQGYFRKRRIRTEISNLSGHYVLCGFGRVGRQVAREFARESVPFVIVEQDLQKVEECLEWGHLAILGDASDDATLEEACCRRARGLVAAVDSDAHNVFVVLSARKMNPNLHIVARASSDESGAKLEIAGADRTLSPYVVGGRHLASLAAQPLIVDFLDIVTHGKRGIEFRLEELVVPVASPLANQTIGELKIADTTGAMILAILSEEGRADTTPSAKDKIHSGDTLIILGTREQISRLETLVAGIEAAGEDF